MFFSRDSGTFLKSGLILKNPGSPDLPADHGRGGCVLHGRDLIFSLAGKAQRRTR